ncbi:GIY-YIG nuclease family protein [Patescibacteria group bacterium]
MDDGLGSCTVWCKALNLFNMFYYVYVLISLRDRNFYIGFTTDLNERITRHHNGDVSSTKNRRPVELIFYEAYLEKLDALRRERYFKTTKGKATIRVMLNKYLEKIDSGRKKGDNKKKIRLL